MAAPITTTNEILIKMESLKGEVDRGFSSLGTRMDRLDDDLRGQYITRNEFAPIKAVVYGQVGIILAGFVGMLLYIIGWAK